jgi:hypothetical protein
MNKIPDRVAEYSHPIELSDTLVFSQCGSRRDARIWGIERLTKNADPVFTRKKEKEKKEIK